MELYVLLELLKWLFVLWEMRNHLVLRQKEKALIATLESYDQRLNSLESKLRLKP
jgi:hypothetical protein